jgi:replicative DNA helicase
MAARSRKTQTEVSQFTGKPTTLSMTPQFLPPASQEAEVSLLGSILINPEVCVRVAEILSPEDFYFPGNRLVARIIWELFDTNSRIDPVIVHEELTKRKWIDSVGGSDYFFKLEESVPDSSHADHYARIVKEKSLLRGLISACHEIIDDANNSPEPVEHVLDRSESKILQVAQSLARGSASHIKLLLHQVLEQIDARLRAGGGSMTGIPSGIPDLDRLTSGFQQSELIVLAARPSMGKTTLALNFAEHAALREKIPVAIFSLESSAEQVARNMLCSHAKIDAHKLRTGFLAKEEWPKIGLACGALSDVPIHIEDTVPLSTFGLKTKARRLKSQYDIKLLIVDYLQMMDSYRDFSRAENRQQEIAEISRQLKGLAKELRIPIIAISQLNRAPEERKGGRPRLSDLRESGAIEQDADVVLLLWREGFYEEDVEKRNRKPDIARLEVAKQRNGPNGIVKLRFNGAWLKFEPLTRDMDVEEFETQEVGGKF